MDKKYISDIFSKEEIDKISAGDRIAIWSQTGSGKSHFVKNVLNKFCSDKNWKCLLISNRKILRSQNEKELRYIGAKNIDTINYQTLEQDYIGGIENLFSGYQVIVFDEVHYLLSDSMFNRNTDILLEMVFHSPSDKVFFFMTATPEAIEYCGGSFNKIYRLESDYSYIEKLYFYSKDDTAKRFISDLPKDEKLIYFSNAASDAYDMSSFFENSSFICSENNKTFYRWSSMDERANIISKESFDSRILCTTKVLDNGVNIKDKSVKHIVIDMVDPITFIQCIGRKRIIDSDDKVSLYVKDYPSNQLSFIRSKYLEKISVAEELFYTSKEDFLARYKKKNLDDIIDNDITVNMAMYYYCKYMAKEIERMIKIGYRNYVCEKLSIDSSRVYFAEEHFEKKTITKILDDWAGKKMFSEEQEKFKNDFFDSVFGVKSRNYRRRGLKSINAIIEEDNIGYVLVSSKESRGENRGKRYWQLIKY